MKKEKEENEFTQLCVWPGTIVEKDNEQDFVEFIAKEFHGARVKFAEEVVTVPDNDKGVPIPQTGGRNDVFFYIHSNDIGKFAVMRLAYGIRWWEDVVSNNSHLIYPKEILEKYKTTW